jgi:uncharacterized membrane-anchored protein
VSRRTVTFLVVSAAVLVGLNVLIVQKERVRRSGQTMLLELAPVDPRSLIQGDYMRLRYAMGDAIDERRADEQIGGRVVVRLDEEDVAEFVRLYDGGELADGEHLLRWKYRRRISLGSNAYYFEEGQSKVYERAEYGELKVAEDGSTLLVGLRDGALERIEPAAGD